MSNSTLTSLLRVAVFVVGGAATLFWIMIAPASVADALPLAGGVRIGLASTLVFLGLAWPGLILAISNVRIAAAGLLSGLAAALYGVMYFAYLPEMSGTVPLLMLALLGIALATYLLCGWHDTTAPVPSFDSVKLRLAALYGAGIGTALWFASFVPLIEHWGTPRSDGFEAIPAFYGTIFFLVFVVPLMLKGLRGTTQLRPNTARTQLVMVLIVSALFGLPLVAG